MVMGNHLALFRHVSVSPAAYLSSKKAFIVRLNVITSQLPCISIVSFVRTQIFANQSTHCYLASSHACAVGLVRPLYYCPTENVSIVLKKLAGQYAAISERNYKPPIVFISEIQYCH